MSKESVAQLVSEQPEELKSIGEKIINNTRITDEDALLLFEKGSLSYTGALANYVRERLHGDKTFFNRNFHIEPTNVCVFTCNFCSYSRLYAHREEGWELSADDMLNIVKKYDGKPETEVHIVGGVHPKLNLPFFADLLRQIRAHRPDLHIKGFTAVELDYMFRKAKMTIRRKIWDERGDLIKDETIDPESSTFAQLQKRRAGRDDPIIDIDIESMEFFERPLGWVPDGG